jgi:hypothetical protein
VTCGLVVFQSRSFVIVAMVAAEEKQVTQPFHYKGANVTLSDLRASDG